MHIVKVAYVEAEGLDARDMELFQALVMDEGAGAVEWLSSDTTDWWLQIEFNEQTSWFLEAADIMTSAETKRAQGAGVTAIELYT